MEYVTVALTEKDRIEPVSVSGITDVSLLDPVAEERFRIIAVVKGFFSADINGERVSVFAPGLICLNEQDVIVLEDTAPGSTQIQTLYFNPCFLHRVLNFRNIRKEGMDVEREVIDNRMMLRAFTENQSCGYAVHLNADSLKRVMCLMDSARHELVFQSSGWWPCKTRSFLTELLFFIFQLYEDAERNSDEADSSVSQEFRPVLAYVARLYNTKLTLDKICMEFNTNRTSLNRWFNKETGMSAISYLIDLRLRIALSILQVTELPVAEVAVRTGFSDATHFERYFKRKYGRCPAEVRKAL